MEKDELEEAKGLVTHSGNEDIILTKLEILIYFHRQLVMASLLGLI